MNKRKLKKFDKYFKNILPFIMVLLIFYLYISLIYRGSFLYDSKVKTSLEFLIMGYFGLELLIKYRIVSYEYNSKLKTLKFFIKKNWLKILLILPFLRIFRVLSFFRFTPLVETIIAGSRFSRFLSYLPYIQKLYKLKYLSFYIRKFSALILIYVSFSSVNKEYYNKKYKSIKDFLEEENGSKK